MNLEESIMVNVLVSKSKKQIKRQRIMRTIKITIVLVISAVMFLFLRHMNVEEQKKAVSHAFPIVKVVQHFVAQ